MLLKLAMHQTHDLGANEPHSQLNTIDRMVWAALRPLTEVEVITHLEGLPRWLKQSVSLHFFFFDKLLLALQVLQFA